MNNNAELDFKSIIQRQPNFDPDSNVYDSVNINSKFYDVDLFIDKYKHARCPVFLNVNIQSLNAKHSKLKELIERFNQNKITIDVLTLQEIWYIKHPTLLELPGYQSIVYKNRSSGKGGGIGFYVRNGLSFKIIEPPFRHYINQIFESLTLEITESSNNNHRQYVITNIYRSPTLVRGYTVTEQYDEFFEKFEQQLMFLNSLKKSSYVFLDSNINLLNVGNNNFVASYLDIICNNGFVLTNFKATRMYNNSNSLIDHMLCNDKSTSLNSGSIIDDLSDHFITFLQPNVTRKRSSKNDSKMIKRRLVTVENLTKLQDSLKNLQWNDVLQTNDVNDCYQTFWTNFKLLYDLHIPVTSTRLNRNYHRVNSFMTTGLMTSRRTKINLLKISLVDPSDANLQNYKRYRNLYNKLLRLAKKKDIEDRLEKNKKKP
jgi:hypothetical protein